MGHFGQRQVVEVAPVLAVLGERPGATHRTPARRSRDHRNCFVEAPWVELWGGPEGAGISCEGRGSGIGDLKDGRIVVGELLVGVCDWRLAPGRRAYHNRHTTDLQGRHTGGKSSSLVMQGAGRKMEYSG